MRCLTGPDVADAGSTRRAAELLIELDRTARTPLRRQLETALRRAVEDGTLADGLRLPSSRSLAEQLGVSRGVVVDAYEQLGAQGFLLTRPRSVPVVRAGPTGPVEWRLAAPRPRFELSPNAPDLRLFPRRLWLRAVADVMRDLPDAELDYPEDKRGAAELRAAVAGYLARVRRARVTGEDVIMTRGFLPGLDLLCRALAARGATRIGVENPSIPDQLEIARGHGLTPVPIPVDSDGLVVDDLAARRVDAVVVTPARQFPLGAVLSPRRRHALIGWARERDALIIENDYDAEFRFDGAPVGALQGLDPQHTVYLGTTSKTLAPAVRLGWLVAPADIARAVTELIGTSGAFTDLTGHVFARLVVTGAYERHVQRCRREYRRRRNALIAALAAELPDVDVLGVSGGLQLTLRLPPGSDADRAAVLAAGDGVHVRPLSYYTPGASTRDPALVLGYGRLPLPSVPAVVATLARAIRRP